MPRNNRRSDSDTKRRRDASRRRSGHASSQAEYAAEHDTEDTGAFSSEGLPQQGDEPSASVGDTAVEGAVASDAAAASVPTMDADAAPAEGPADDSELSRYSRSNASSYTARSGRTSKSGHHRVLIGVIIALVVVLVGAGVAIGLWYNNLSSQLRGSDDISEGIVPEVEDEPYYVLLLGSDSRTDSEEEEASRTDSIMVARVDEVNKKVSLISVPRDLRVNLGEYGYEKINAAYVYGGYELTLKTVSDVLGVDISYYAFIYFGGFEDLVDKLGGVTVDVPEGTYYNGVWVPAGKDVEINGEEALTLARCRHGYPPDTGAYAMGDYRRTQNQRNLIAAIAKKILAQNVTEYPSLISGLAECVDTNMSIEKLVNLATDLRGMDVDSIKSFQVPVAGWTGDAWYAVAYEDVFEVVKDNFINGRSFTKGIKGFDKENNDNAISGYPIDGDIYSYVFYEDLYGDFRTKSDSDG
ncbi:MAG: LCP family protein [Coriobacteriaceae bacterium]|nr:LCP family protein [Coriobacteriaceae bacterium]